MKLIEFLIKLFIRIFILYPIFLLSYFILRKKNLWVFGSHNDTFSDNSKYLFLYIGDNHPEIKATWISENKRLISFLNKKRFKASYRWSIKGIWICLRAKIYVYSAYLTDINVWTSGRALKLNLWHGIPLKKIENDIIIGPLAEKYNSWKKIFFMIYNPAPFIRPSYLLSTSPLITNIFSSAFKIKPENCLEFGYPRNDILFWPREKIEFFIKEKSPELTPFVSMIKKYKWVIIYMPTFREFSKQHINDIINFDLLNRFFQKNKIIMLIKLHPNLKRYAYLKYSNIIYIPSFIDVYPLLPFTNLLISDYSSILFDYALLKKPIILFAHDLEHYLKNERGFYFDIKSLFGRGIIYESEDLEEIIYDFINNTGITLFLPQYEFRKTFWGNYAGNSIEKLFLFLKDKLIQ